MNTNTKDSIILYTDNKGNVELRADAQKDTLWGTQDQIAQLFDTSKQLISWHIANIYKQKELQRKSTVKESLTVASNNKRYKFKFYNLDVMLAVGYRVNSKKATKFRIWATKILRDYLINGFAVNQSKLESSTERLEGLHETMALLESKKYRGKVKGKLTLKLSKDMEEI